MSKGARAFDTLSDGDRKTLIDLAAAMAVFTTRLPETAAVISSSLIGGFCRQTDISTSTANYALQDLWKSMLDQDWEFRVTKKDDRLVTQFTPIRTAEGTNGGEEPSRIIAP